MQRESLFSHGDATVSKCFVHFFFFNWFVLSYWTEIWVSAHRAASITLFLSLHIVWMHTSPPLHHPVSSPCLLDNWNSEYLSLCVNVLLFADVRKHGQWIFIFRQNCVPIEMLKKSKCGCQNGGWYSICYVIETQGYSSDFCYAIETQGYSSDFCYAIRTQGYSSDFWQPVFRVTVFDFSRLGQTLLVMMSVKIEQNKPYQKQTWSFKKKIILHFWVMAFLRDWNTAVTTLNSHL